MKKALVTLNLILAAAVAIIVLTNIATDKKSNSAKKKAAVKSSTVQSSTRKSTEKKNAEKKEGAEETPAAKLLPPAEAAAKIVEKDVFNQIRSPLAFSRVGRSEMTLVGVIDGKAAIIKTNIRQQQFNPYLAQAMRMGAAMRGGNGGPPGGRFTQWSQMSNNRRNGPVQQYVRLGETMNSGYVLVEVTRSRAVLERGNDKLELELQDPSKNRTAARQSQPQKLNATQQFQQAQMFMQSQMIRTMRDIQRNSSSNRAPQGNRNRR